MKVPIMQSIDIGILTGNGDIENHGNEEQQQQHLHSYFIGDSSKVSRFCCSPRLFHFDRGTYTSKCLSQPSVSNSSLAWVIQPWLRCTLHLDLHKVRKCMPSRISTGYIQKAKLWLYELRSRWHRHSPKVGQP
jgi:hypothetical protein